MELAQQLIRSIARAFYEPRHILIIDALTVHSTLWVDDLATLLNTNAKEMRKMAAPLRDDKLVAV